jgi:hypothetical protein
MSLWRVSNCTWSNSFVNKSANCFTPSVCSNTGDIFQVATHHLPCTSISTLIRLDSQGSIVLLSSNDILTTAENLFTLHICNNMVRCTKITYHLSTSLMLFTLTTEHTGPLVSSTEHVVCHLWLILVTFQFLAILFLITNIPTMKTAAVFSVVFVWLFQPTWFAQHCFDRHRLRLHGWCMFHKCTRPCHCCQLCKSFSIVQCFKQDCSLFACCHRLPYV